MAVKNEAMKSALRSLMAEMGAMNMDRVRKMKMPPRGPMKMEEPPKKRGKAGQHAHMGDPDMDD